MLWNRFDEDRSRLNLYDDPHFEPGSGIADRNVLIDYIESLPDKRPGQPHALIKAEAVAYVLDNAAIEINPVDWFGINYCGWLTCKSAPLQERRRYRHPVTPLNDRWLREIPEPEAFVRAGAHINETGAGIFWPDYDHSVPDWDSVIGLGFSGLLERVRHYHGLHREDGTLSEDMEVYYRSVETAYEAILRFMDRLIACAEKHRADDERMPLIIECLTVLRYGHAQTLYQFLMQIYLYHLIQEQLDRIQVRTLGNIDADGYPFYRADVEAGRLTKENAEELFRYFFEKYTNQGHIHGQPLYFGGFDENGDSLINELSYIMLDAYDKSAIVNPKLFVKVMPNTPDSFLKKALDMIRRGHNALVFINEELGMKISRKLGRTEEETRRLVGTGCNNFASRGHETTPEHMYVNLAKGIELAFNDGYDPQTGADIGVRTGSVENFRTFEDFRDAYYRQTECLIGKAFVISDFYDSHLLDINPAPVYSGSMPDSVKCGRDAYQNGVKYNNTVMFLSCHATAADSLMMVKKHVFDRHDVTMSELRDALLHNWEGYEALHDVMKNDPEKFGNNMDTVDGIAVELLDRFTSLVTARKNMRGGHFVVNGESIWFSHLWSEKCGATPDGRARGDLLSKNMSASFGQDRRGITAHILSATKIDATNLAYGCPFDYVLHATAVKGDDGLDAMLDLLRTFMARGGYGFQGNVQDAAVLRDAQEHPENYPTLQVRISGWSWYFTQMEKRYQDEFIKRAEMLEG